MLVLCGWGECMCSPKDTPELVVRGILVWIRELPGNYLRHVIRFVASGCAVRQPLDFVAHDAIWHHTWPRVRRNLRLGR